MSRFSDEEKEIVANTVQACLETIDGICKKNTSSNHDRHNLRDNILINLFGCGIFSGSKQTPIAFAMNSLQAIKSISNWFHENSREDGHSCKHCEK